MRYRSACRGADDAGEVPVMRPRAWHQHPAASAREEALKLSRCATAIWPLQKQAVATSLRVAGVQVIALPASAPAEASPDPASAAAEPT